MAYNYLVDGDAVMVAANEMVKENHISLTDALEIMRTAAVLEINSTLMQILNLVDEKRANFLQKVRGGNI